MARTACFGKSGSGKSWYAGQVLEQILDPDDPDDEFEFAVHVDLEDEERGLSKKGDALLKTYEVDKETLRKQVVVDKSEPPEYVPEKELKDGQIFAEVKWVIYRNKYVRVVPNGLSQQEKSKLCEMCADAAMLAGDCHFSMDEAHRIISDSGIEQKMSELITGGRKRGVEWFFVTQRPQLVSKTMIAQADKGVFFKLTSERDIKKADKLAQTFDAEDVLPKLPNRVAIVEDYDTGEAKKIETENLERDRPHVAGDDGKADDKWTGSGTDFRSTEEIIEPDDTDDT